jgi:hypothetical protein
MDDPFSCSLDNFVEEPLEFVLLDARIIVGGAKAAPVSNTNGSRTVMRFIAKPFQ